MTIMDWLFGKFFIPLAYYIRGDCRFSYYRTYMAHMSKTPKEIKKYQNKRIQKLVQHAYNTTVYYKELFDKLKIRPHDIKNIEDLQKIPVLEKETILSNIENLKSKKKYKLFEDWSGGSTGNRVVVYKDKKFKEISRAVVLRDLASVGLKPGHKVAWFWGSPMENTSLKKNILHQLLWFVNRRIIFNTFHYTDKELKEWLEGTYTHFNAKYVYGYARSIYEVALFIKRHNLQLPQVKSVITTAQTLEHRKVIQEAFNCPVIDQYGCREVPSIAIEDKKGIMHSSDDYVAVEIDKNNRVLLTPLESYGMPLLRYAVGDIGIKKQTKRNDKHPFSQFNITVGRVTEMLKNTLGEKIYSGKINLEIAKRKLDVGEFQLIQTSLKKVELKIVKTKNMNKKHVKQLEQIIKNILGTEIVHITYINEFPVEKSGKKISFKCLVK